jgi:hypothetical protein
MEIMMSGNQGPGRLGRGVSAAALLAVLALAAAPTLAIAQCDDPGGTIDEAADNVEFGLYEEADAALRGLREQCWESLSQDLKIRVLEMLGRSAAVQRDLAAAQQTFEELLVEDPTWRPPELYDAEASEIFGDALRAYLRNRPAELSTDQALVEFQWFEDGSVTPDGAAFELIARGDRPVRWRAEIGDDAGWLTLDPASGSVAPYEPVSLNVTIDGFKLVPPVRQLQAFVMLVDEDAPGTAHEVEVRIVPGHAGKPFYMKPVVWAAVLGGVGAAAALGGGGGDGGTEEPVDQTLPGLPQLPNP